MYSFRYSVLEKEKIFSFTDAHLRIQEAETGNIVEIPLRSIIEVKLSFANSKSMPDAYLCTIKTDNGRTIKLKNLYYKGIANFEPRNELYNAFVLQLHQTLGNYPQVNFRHGISKLGYYFMFVLSIILMIALLIIGVFALFSTVIVGIVMLIAVPLYSLKLRDYLKKNKPGSYAYNAVPLDLLAK